MCSSCGCKTNSNHPPWTTVPDSCCEVFMLICCVWSSSSFTLFMADQHHKQHYVSSVERVLFQKSCGLSRYNFANFSCHVLRCRIWDDLFLDSLAIVFNVLNLWVIFLFWEESTPNGLKRFLKPYPDRRAATIVSLYPCGYLSLLTSLTYAWVSLLSQRYSYLVKWSPTLCCKLSIYFPVQQSGRT